MNKENSGGAESSSSLGDVAFILAGNWSTIADRINQDEYIYLHAHHDETAMTRSSEHIVQSNFALPLGQLLAHMV